MRTQFASSIPPALPSTYGKHRPSIVARPPQFGRASLISGVIKSRPLLEHLDFTTVGASPVAQIGLIFSSLITWRLLAANERRRASESKRWNELRENLMRDLLGFAFWFLGVPILQRLYLAAVAKHNPALKNILIQKMESEKPQTLLGWLKANNPLNNQYIPSSQQVKDQMHQALKTLETAKIGPGHPAYQQTRAVYEHLIKHRNFATALGLGSTILLLGVGINLINFYLTRKNISREMKAPVPTASAPARSPFQSAFKPTTQPIPQAGFSPQVPFPTSYPSAPY